MGRLNNEPWSICINCRGRCCRWQQVILTEEEKELLTNKTGNKEFLADCKGLKLKQKKNGYCFFYDEKKHRCTVYRLRPRDCRIFPLDIRNREGKPTWFLWTMCRAVKQHERTGKLRSLTKSMDLNRIDFLEKRTANEIASYANSQPKNSKGMTWKFLDVVIARDGTLKSRRKKA